MQLQSDLFRLRLKKEVFSITRKNEFFDNSKSGKVLTLFTVNDRELESFRGSRGRSFLGTIHGEEVVCDPEHDNIDDEWNDEDDEDDFEFRTRNGPKEEVLDIFPEMELKENSHSDFGHQHDENVGQTLVPPVLHPRLRFPILTKHQVLVPSPHSYSLSEQNPQVDHQETETGIQQETDDVSGWEWNQD